MRYLLFPVLFLISASAAGQVNFKRKDYFPQIVSPTRMVQGDFNNDGVLDVAASGEYAIHVLLNAQPGPGNLANYSMAFPSHVIAGDIDGDGDLDLATVATNTLTLLINSGDGKFTITPTTHVLPNTVFGMTAADFNEDGFDDIVVSVAFTDLFVFTGKDVGLDAHHYILESPGDLNHGDIDQDGHEDLIITNSDVSGLKVYPNMGDAVFGAPVNYPLPDNVGPLLVIDIDGDTQQDIVAAIIGDNPAVRILKNSSGSLSLLKSYPNTVFSYYDLAAGDLNGDHFPDLAFTDFYKGKMTRMLNDGHGNFGDTIVQNIGGQPSTVLIGDYDHDGAGDLFIGNYSRFQIAFNRGNDLFPVTTFGADFPQSVVQHDFNGDGSPDLASNNYNDQSISLMLNDRHGGFLSKTEFHAGFHPFKIVKGDVNGDHVMDLLVANDTVDSLTVLIGSGNGSFTFSGNNAGPHFLSDFALADLNSDGKDDLVVTGTDVLYVSFSTGTNFQAPSLVSSPSHPGRVATGDLNGDHVPDILLSSASVEPLSLILNSGNGTFGSRVPIIENQLEVLAIAISDFDRDGLNDIGFTTSSQFFILPNEGNGSFTSRQVLPSGLYEASHIALGDYTGDGLLDIALSTGNSAAIAVLVANDDATYEAPVICSSLPSIFDIARGDFDLDGQDDIAAVSWPFGYLSIYRSLPKLTIIAHDTTRVYGDPDPTFKSTVTGWPGPGDPLITYPPQTAPTSIVGQYPIIAVAGPALTENFAVVSFPGTLTIAPAPLTLKARDTIRQVHEPNPPLVVDVTGVRNNELFQFFLTTSASFESPPGEYPIIPLVSPSLSNYAPTLINGTLTVTPITGLVNGNEKSGLPYPNPSHGDFFIDSAVPPLSFQVEDWAGRIIKEGIANPGTNLVHLEAPAGLYFIKFENGRLEKLAIDP